MKLIKLLICILIFASCSGPSKEKKGPVTQEIPTAIINETSLVVLGTVQDAGSPHIACKKECCKELFVNPDANRKVVSLGLIDAENEKTYLFEATPDISEQLKNLMNKSPFNAIEIPNGIFITHAHIGHYTGLMYLGKEATNAKNALVYVMPKLKTF